MEELERKRLEALFESCQVKADEPIERDNYTKRPTNVPLTLEEAIKRVACFNNESFGNVVQRRPRMVSDNVMEDDEDVYLLPNSDRFKNVYHIPKVRLIETEWLSHLNNKAWLDMQMLQAFKQIQKAYIKEKAI